MTNWSFQYINDPENDYELMVEIYFNDEEIATIKQEEDGLILIIYAHNKDLSIPFKWFNELLNKVKENLITNNLFLYKGEELLRIPQELLIPLYNCLNSKLKKQKLKIVFYGFMKKLKTKICGQDTLLIDLYDSFKNKKKLILFIDLFNNCVNEMSKQYEWFNKNKKKLNEFTYLIKKKNIKKESSNGRT